MTSLVNVLRSPKLWIALVATIVPLLLFSSSPVGSESAPTGSAASLEQKINTTRGKIEFRKAKESKIQAKISRVSAKINSLQGGISKLRSRQTRIQADLDVKRNALIKTQTDLRVQRARLARLKSRLAEGRKILSRRIVEHYQDGDPDLITVVLNSKGFEDLLERGEAIKRVNARDRHIIGLVTSAKTDATSLANKLDKLEAKQQTITTAILARRNEVAGVKQKLLDRQAGWDAARDEKAAILKDVSSERHHLEEHLDDLEAASAKVTNTLQAQQGGAGSISAGPIKQGSGQMIWPVSGSISGDFGEQRPGHIHAGIDIPAAEGTPIRAADSGKVVLMQPVAASGGYGNYTCIAHSSTLSTCYAHQVRFGTSMGASVTKGDVIGYVGNTGHSFGAHLHFEVRVNGVPTQPLNYL